MKTQPVKIVIGALLIVFAGYAFSQDLLLTLEKGLSRESIPSTIKKAMWHAPGGPFIASAIVVSDENNYYWLFRNSSVNRFDISSSQNVESWQLTRWSHQYSSPNTARVFAALGVVYPLDFNTYERIGMGVGCLGESPMRYGDIEGDGVDELVIMLNGLLVVFSPLYERVVFSEYLDESDWMTQRESAQFFGDIPLKRAQFPSRTLAQNDLEDIGVRSYAKLYFGDFDNDGNPDILAWRKAYESHLITNPTPGFLKLDDDFQHFERDLDTQAQSVAGITGEYLPQSTAPVLIRDWLSQHSLTWPLGYPSESECPGEEGQLIPEMHDPLLNDPEVLSPPPEL